MHQYHTDCRHFSGYRPCGIHPTCNGCPHYDKPQKRILIINEGAMGDVLRTTALLPVLRRHAPLAHVTWITQSRACPLIQSNPLLDRVMPLTWKSKTVLLSEHFDLILNVDKDPVSCALMMQLNADSKKGFGLSSTGAIIPLNSEAERLYELGLDNKLKFFVNTKAETQLLCEAMGFVYERDPYGLELPSHNLSPKKVGFNTGSSPAFPLKALDRTLQAEAIELISNSIGESVLLLGGPEDTERNNWLHQKTGEASELSPTTEGVLVGAQHIDRCQVIFSGDSLGMHLAIARKKYVVAWFGLSCPQEIDLYDRGIRLRSDVGCAPCWQKSCTQTTKCNTKVSLDWIHSAVLDALDAAEKKLLIQEDRGASW